MDPTDFLFDIRGSFDNYISGQVGIIIISKIGNTVTGPQKGIYWKKSVLSTRNRPFFSTQSEVSPFFGHLVLTKTQMIPVTMFTKKKDTSTQMPKKRRIYSALLQYSGKLNHKFNLKKNLQKFKNVAWLLWYFLEIVRDFSG